MDLINDSDERMCQECTDDAVIKRLEAEVERLRSEFSRINVRDPELMAKVRGYANAEHGLVVDMQDGTGRTGLYVETGLLRLLLARNEELEDLARKHILGITP